MKYRLIHADVLDGLAQLGDESVQCVVTSPPYFGLRDYGVSGQIGLEPTPDDYVERLVDVFREVRRVMKDDGTLWLNLGDSYAGSWGAQSREHAGKHAPNVSALSANQVKAAHLRSSRTGSLDRTPGCKAKDLVGIPWMVAFALRADGWYLRSDIIWSKPNPMPESITDRPTKSHEYLFLLTKAARYYYDADAIKEPASYGVPNSPDSISSPYGQGFTRRALVHSVERGIGGSTQPDVSGVREGEVQSMPAGAEGHGDGLDVGTVMDPSTSVPKNDKQSQVKVVRRGHARRHVGSNERWDAMERAEQCSGVRNKRSVWTVATQPFPEAHFATFPTALVEPCILAGSKVGDTILDPFNGSGTTGVVALSHQRDYIGIELNAEFVAMARRRLSQVAPMFAQEIA